MKNRIAIGQTVRNFGETATVIGFHEKTGNPILRDADGLKWIADPAKCEVVKDAFIHRDGLVAFI